MFELIIQFTKVLSHYYADDSEHQMGAMGLIFIIET